MKALCMYKKYLPCVTELRCASVVRFVQTTSLHPYQQDKCSQACTYPLLPSLPQDSMGLDADALYSIHHHEAPIAQPGCCADFTAEIYMARGVNKVDQVPCTSHPSCECEG